MPPPLRQRLGPARAPRPVRARHGDRGLMARSLMFLFFAGASIALLALIFGQAPADEPRMTATAASGFGIAALLLVGYDRLPGWTFPILLACGTMLIEWTIYSSGESTSALAVVYFWLPINAALTALPLYCPSSGVDSFRIARGLELPGPPVGRAIRRIDVATRTGDHTFAVIVPYASAHGAYVLAERIQTEVLEELSAATEGHGIEVAVGMASFPEHASTVEELRHGADQAVTAARKLGPSRVVAYSPDAQVSAVA